METLTYSFKVDETLKGAETSVINIPMVHKWLDTGTVDDLYIAPDRDERYVVFLDADTELLRFVLTENKP